jgi:hypothetical protein
MRRCQPFGVNETEPVGLDHQSGTVLGPLPFRWITTNSGPLLGCAWGWTPEAEHGRRCSGAACDRTEHAKAASSAMHASWFGRTCKAALSSHQRPYLASSLPTDRYTACLVPCCSVNDCTVLPRFRCSYQSSAPVPCTADSLLRGSTRWPLACVVSFVAKGISTA